MVVKDIGFGSELVVRPIVEASRPERLLSFDQVLHTESSKMVVGEEDVGGIESTGDVDLTAGVFRDVVSLIRTANNCIIVGFA